jgi:23S rRNA (adenine2503-C2)-methyltransferase
MLSEMTNVGKATKEKITAQVDCSFPTVKRKLCSHLDETVKYLFELSDKNCIESVVMKYEHGYTICVSSQVGCRMGCKFCASTIAGRVRDLSAGEILGQIIAAQRDLGIRISNVVMMGIGEPLDNYDNTVKFLRLVNHPDGINIGYRHISLSTCGVVPKIRELAKLDMPITLSVSLHASDDETRSAIMPVNKSWGVDELLSACRDYYGVTGRRMSFEYTLISGKNDSVESATRLASVLNSRLRTRTDTMPIHVNLIPVNEVEESGFQSSGKDAVRKFAAELEKRGIRATVRRTLGSDINASCGQLRREDSVSQTK